MKSAYIITSILIFLVSLGCAAFSTNAYKTLDIQASLYESSKDLANSLPTDTWTAEEKAKIEEAAYNYKLAYHTAVEALAKYAEVESMENKDVVVAALEKLKEVVAYFSELTGR